MTRLLEESLGGCPVVDINGYRYLVHPLTDGLPAIDPRLLDEVVGRMADIADLDCNRIVTSEAMGIPVAVLLSQRTGIPLTIVRRRRYGLPGEVSLAQHTGYADTELHINGVGRGDRVLLVDDVLSTGGTLRAIADALTEVIGAVVVDIVVIFDKSGGRATACCGEGRKVKALLEVKVDGEKVTHSPSPP